MTYLYCLVRAGANPVRRRTRGGIPGGGAVRALDAAGGLWLIVSDVGERDYGEQAIAAGLQKLEWVSVRALGHERVVEQFLAAEAVLPMQLFTIFKTDERALAHVAQDRARIERILTRVQGHVEWGLRLLWDEQAARAAVEKAHAAKDPRAGGADYLARKRDLLNLNRAQLAEARAEATRVFTSLAMHASDAVRRTSTEQAAPGSRLLLDAAYLVPATGTSRFRSALRRETSALKRSGLAVALTGPWPPYNFIA